MPKNLNSTRIFLAVLMLSAMFFLPFLGGLKGVQKADAARVVNRAGSPKPFQHHLFQSVLSEAVDETGHVDFVALRGNPRVLNQYLDQLASVSPESHPDYFQSREAELAYWINAHNALGLRLILDVYPVDTLTQVGGFYDNPRYLLGGKAYTLTELETAIGERFFVYPGAVFALSDFTQASPPLLNQAYTSETLEKQLEAQTRQYIQLPGVVEVSEDCSEILLNSYLRRYEPVLLTYLARKKHQADPTILDFIQSYTTPETHARLNQDCMVDLVDFVPPSYRFR